MPQRRSGKENLRKPTPLGRDPGVFQPRRLEQLEELRPRRAVVPRPVAPHDLQQLFGRAVAVAIGHQAVRQFEEGRSEEHTSELQSLMRISYAVFCLKKKNKQNIYYTTCVNIDTEQSTLSITMTQNIEKHQRL